MSAVIYIRSGDDEPSLDQLALLHKFSDQARVWAHLLFKEASQAKDFYEREALRSEWMSAQRELGDIDPNYLATLINQHRKSYQEGKSVMLPPLPPPPPNTGDPVKDEKILSLAKHIRDLFEEVHPVREDVSYPFSKLEQDRACTAPGCYGKIEGEPRLAGTAEPKYDEKGVLLNPEIFPPKEHTEGHHGPDNGACLRGSDTHHCPCQQFTPKAGGFRTQTEIVWNPIDAAKLADEFKAAAHIDDIAAWYKQVGLDPEEMGGSISGMLKGQALNKGVDEAAADAIAQDALTRALYSYDPYVWEDTGKFGKGSYTKRPSKSQLAEWEKLSPEERAKNIVDHTVKVPDVVAEWEKLSPEERAKRIAAGTSPDRPAKFGTYLFSVVQNAINDYFNKRNKQLQKERPVEETVAGDEDDGRTREETLAAKEPKPGIPWDEYLPLFKKWLEAKGTLTPDQIANRLDIFKRMFINHERLSEVAAELGYKSYLRTLDMSALKSAGVDTSSLAEPKLANGETNLNFNKTQDKIDRAKLWDAFIDVLGKKAAASQGEERQKLVDRLAAVKELRANAWTPNAALISNIFWHDQHPSAKNKTPEQLERVPSIDNFLKSHDDLRHLVVDMESNSQMALEDFLSSISTLRKEGGLNYELLRNKIQQKLEKEGGEQLFVVYTHLYELAHSNPDTARLMKLSPPRITGLKKKIVASLLELPEISSIFTQGNSTSPMGRFIYKVGDAVRVESINELGVIQNVGAKWFNIQLDNGNEVLTVKSDISKHCTLIESTFNALSHYFNREVITPQCYLSLVAGASSKLVILELRPASEVKTTARLHVNNNLIDITEISEEFPDNLISIVKGHLGASATLDTPFTSLFTEYEA